MTYAAQEISTTGGHPLELFRFVAGTQRWTMTPHVEPIVHVGETYDPTPMTRSAPEIGSDAARAELTITLPRSHDLARRLLLAPPPDVVSVAVYRRHLTDPDAETIVWWRGRIVSVTVQADAAALRCESLLAALRRPGLRARYGLLCRHALYSVGCGASANAHRVPGTVTAVAGAVVTVPAAAAYAAGHFTAGMLVASGGAVRHFVVGHSGPDLTLMHAAVDIVGGLAVDLYAGCDHTLTTCHARFNNAANFGGFPWIPRKNPFAGDAIV